MHQSRTDRSSIRLSTLLVQAGHACLGLVLAALTGCASIGAQYVPPSSTQPAATLVPKGGGFFISTHDDAGCYQGRAELPSEKELRLHPGREVIVVYESSAPVGYQYGTRLAPAAEPVYSVCRALISFVPQEGARYTISGTTGVTTALHSCGAAVSRKTSDGASEALPVKRLVLRQKSLACIQARQVAVP